MAQHTAHVGGIHRHRNHSGRGHGQPSTGAIESVAYKDPNHGTGIDSPTMKTASPGITHPHCIAIGEDTTIHMVQQDLFGRLVGPAPQCVRRQIGGRDLHSHDFPLRPQV
ncbi:unannotated protein [freshwater metagenome]|uniref:Unannotated protein n=1 Tax=freshwater metagenome TaxID=449393 RepID=A0A6J6YG85_9ZZZZ